MPSRQRPLSRVAPIRSSCRLSLYGGFVPDDSDQYRRKRASDTWHFCSNCSTWPGWNYHVSYERPSTGKLCKECQTSVRMGPAASFQRPRGATRPARPTTPPASGPLRASWGASPRWELAPGSEKPPEPEGPSGFSTRTEPVLRGLVKSTSSNQLVASGSNRELYSLPCARAVDPIRTAIAISTDR
jgi:hypothetical protein